MSRTFALIGLLFTSLLFAQAPDILPPLVSGGSSAPIRTNFNGVANQFHTLQAFVTGAPAVCTMHLYGSVKNWDESTFPADYQDLSGAIDCTTVTMVHIANKPVRTVLVNLTTMSGGTSPTFNFRYVGR